MPAPEVGSEAAKVNTRGGWVKPAGATASEVMKAFTKQKQKIICMIVRLSHRADKRYFSFPLISDFLMMSDGFRTWMCLICGWIYDEEAGCPEEGIAPGTRWEDVPPNWTCPECGARKEDFEMVEL
jgi:rubredoxin